VCCNFCIPLIAIKKDNLLHYYHAACVKALKPTKFQFAFQKTGIWPVNREAIPLTAFEPSKNTTTEAAQPLPTHLPSILVPTPSPTPIPTPIPSPTPSAAIPLHCNANAPAGAASEGLPDEERTDGAVSY
jgi:hypothetical protein